MSRLVRSLLRKLIAFPAQRFRAMRQRALLRRVTSDLGVSGFIRDLGASTEMRIQLPDRVLQIGTNGERHWLKTDLRWEGFPETAAVSCLLHGGYWREAALSEGTPHAITGDPTFDATFMVLGEACDTEILISKLTPAIRNLLVAHQDLQVSISPMELFAFEGPVVHRLHMHAELGPEVRNQSPLLHAARKLIHLVEAFEQLAGEPPVDGIMPPHE